MHKKTIKLNPLSVSSIEKAIKEVETYEKWLKGCYSKFIQEMAKEGMAIADYKFANAEYDGENNEIKVSVESRGEYNSAVIAMGEAVLFIEFGTGIVHSRTNPEPIASSFPAKSYSLSQQGKNAIRKDGRWYYKDGNDKAKISYGNPSNNSMYETKKELANRIKEIAERCFV